jgi:crotonobetaine/carnitine-CoA ligase
MVAMGRTAVQERTLPWLLERQADAFGDKPLLRGGGEVWSYRDTVSKAAALAGNIRSAGLEPGDRVAVMCGNRPDVIRTWLGCGWSGMVTVPVNVALRGLQLEHVLVDSGAKLLVLEPSCLEYLELIESPLPGLERLWTVGDEPAPTSWRDRPVERIPYDGPGTDPHRSRPGDTLTIFYTGGTTGPSKGVCSPHAQSYWWGRNAGTELGIGPSDVLHTTLPLFHTNGLHTFWQALLAGATFSFGRRFSASRFVTELAESEATVTYLLGAMVKILLSRAPAPTDCAHSVRLALAPGTSPDALEEFEARFGIELVDAYGSTETNMITSSGRPGSRRGTMGQLVKGFEASVVDEHDQPVAPGAPGELVLRNSEPFSFFTGYWGNAQHTADACRNLWFHTGDRVVRDEEGNFTFVDRIKDAIRRRGENISSWEVEQVLVSHPGVDHAAVVPVPAELGEDEVMAFIVPREGERPDPGDIISHCEPRLAYFAIPRFIEFVDELPLTQVGRVQKFVLRDRGRGPQTWDREAAGSAVGRSG